MSESSRRQAIRTALTRAGYLVVARPAGPFGGRGVSDFLVCAHGRFIALEVKDDHGVATVAQKAFLNDVDRCGGTGYIVRTVEEALECVEHALQRTPEWRYHHG